MGRRYLLEDSSSDGHVRGEGALLIDIVSFNSFTWCLESKTDLLVIPHSLSGLLGEQLLAVEESSTLLLESFLCLCEINDENNWLVILLGRQSSS